MNVEMTELKKNKRDTSCLRICYANDTANCRKREGSAKANTAVQSYSQTMLHENRSTQNKPNYGIVKNIY